VPQQGSHICRVSWTVDYLRPCHVGKVCYSSKTAPVEFAVDHITAAQGGPFAACPRVALALSLRCRTILGPAYQFWPGVVCCGNPLQKTPKTAGRGPFWRQLSAQNYPVLQGFWTFPKIYEVGSGEFVCCVCCQGRMPGCRSGFRCQSQARRADERADTWVWQGLHTPTRWGVPSGRKSLSGPSSATGITW
jgi:hypothetical protein